MTVDNWMVIKNTGRFEMEKWRYCRGCKYLSSAGHNGCCDYFLMTGKRRPCQIGKDCTVREYKKDYKQSDSHVAWCKEVDERLEAERIEQERRQAKEQSFMRSVRDAPKVTLDYALDRKHGRPRSFDYDYAFYLYCRGFYISDIREILSISGRVNLNDIAMNEWRDKRPPGVQFQWHDVKAEKEKYRLYKAQLEQESKL